MKAKFLICCLLLITVVLCGLPVSAEGGFGASQEEIEEIISDVAAYKSGGTELQLWLDGGLAGGAGSSSDWYALALSRYDPSLDFTAYAVALEGYLQENRIASATTRQRCALTLLASGRKSSPFVISTSGDSIGEQGVMSWIFGLHLLNNGVISEKYSSGEVIDRLLSMQLDDGGWALRGEVSDVDVTAMALQALAPRCGDANVGDAAGRAVERLGSLQLESGGYQSYGSENPESCAQVIVALTALGIDFSEDGRFIKDGCTPLDAMLRFRLEDGGFCHEYGGAFSEAATCQAFYSLIALWRAQSGLSPFYLFDDSDAEAEGTAEASPPASTGTASEPVDTEAPPESGETSGNGGERSYKPATYIIISAICLAACIILCLCGKRNIKNYIFVLILGAAAACVVFFTDFSTAGDYYSSELPEKTNVTGTVTLTIRCDTVAGSSDSEYIPEDGVILPVTGFSITGGDSVFDILTEAAKKHGIQIENKGALSGGGGMVYISGISYLYEFDFGELSGWIYRVNGKTPSVSCGDYILSDGDVIEWLYSREAGDDLE